MWNRTFIRLKSLGFGNQRSIPGLDGLRAISISLVILGHLTGTQNFPRIFDRVAPLSEFGVRVFFVISGYLITSILLKEFQTTGTISLSRFYIRRTLRLFPASYFLIVVVACLAAKHWLKLEHWDLLFAATYTMDFYNTRGWPLGHLWSLAVEEQFYLLWPLMFLHLQPRRAITLLWWVLAACPVLRLLSLYAGPASNFLVWSDALATGCLLMLLGHEFAVKQWWLRLITSRFFFLVPLVAIAANYTPSTKLTWLFSETIMNMCIALCVAWVVRNQGTTSNKILNAPAVVFLGVLSYSLYLWQQLFLDRYSASPYCRFPLNVFLALLAAMASYLLIEVPVLRIRASLESRPVTNRELCRTA
jgi:peptidoglycan/LPS O-acetylase OafA/YrhL